MTLLEVSSVLHWGPYFLPISSYQRKVFVYCMLWISIKSKKKKENTLESVVYGRLKEPCGSSKRISLLRQLSWQLLLQMPISLWFLWVFNVQWVRPGTLLRYSCCCVTMRSRINLCMVITIRWPQVNSCLSFLTVDTSVKSGLFVECLAVGFLLLF